METLYEMLRAYAKSDYYGFHMPGHKRNDKILGLNTGLLPYRLDITEIEGFDDLHHARGVLKDAQMIAQDVYGAEESHFLINGSTVGILAAIFGCTKKGDRILMARNCHKSVYNAVYMNELDAKYLYPEYIEEESISGRVSEDEVERQLSIYPDIKAVVIVSPTYDGVVSNIRKIAESVHKRGIPLIVDEAHGAHFGFHPVFPKNANVYGADIVIHCLHKTLPALTQSGLLHINGCLVERDKVRRYLSMLQSSSPSYILMSGLDACIRWLKKDAAEVFDSYAEMLNETRERLRKLQSLHLMEPDGMESSKILISTKNTDISGSKLLMQLLDRFHLQMEMASVHYVTAMTSVGDKKQGMKRLCDALEILDKERIYQPYSQKMVSLPRPEKIFSMSEMERKEKETVCWDRCEGKIAAEMVYVYPPGIPLIVPGERISLDVIECVKLYESCGFIIEGTKEEKKIQIERD